VTLSPGLVRWATIVTLVAPVVVFIADKAVRELQKDAPVAASVVGSGLMVLPLVGASLAVLLLVGTKKPRPKDTVVCAIIGLVLNGGMLMLCGLGVSLFLLGRGSSPTAPGVGATVDPKTKAAELAALAGYWVYERQVVRGKEIPIAQTDKSHILIRGDSLVREIYSADGRRLTPIRSTICVDPTLTPKQLDDDQAGPFGVTRHPAIYKLEGDRLTLCWNNSGPERPTTFDSPAGSSFVLSVLRRQDNSNSE
jgi:uncharacterized protein (TIGR03067 family)